MHVLRTPPLFCTPYPWLHPYCCCCYSSTPVPKPPPPAAAARRRHLPWSLGRSLAGAVATPLSSSTAAGCAKGFRSQEFPIGPDDESYLEKYRPKDKETEDEARRRNWIDRDWAPWEEILTPEGDFARKSLNEGEEVPLQTPEALEAFRMLTPKYRKKKMAELGLTEDEFYAKQFDIKGEILEPLQTTWDCPLVVCNLPPRDWPPRGWLVPPEELRFIREAHRSHNLRRVSFQDIANATDNADGLCEDRYNMFLKQYNEWVLHNKDRLEQESYKYDQDYHPGRRKRGKDYREGMYELPFYYPGQLCIGKVTTLHLYQGVFVDIGGVYEGWVPIKGNDWYWIRQHIKVGMIVMVEILAKRDPYRFRFPIEMRFVDPNIDHLIFRRFEYPPIFHHQADTNPDELRRDCGRPPIPRKDPKIKVEEEGLKSNHPYVDRLWQLHNAEQLILDDMEENPQKYEGKKITELIDDEEINEENCVEYTKVHLTKGRRKGEIGKMILRTSVKDLDLEAALAERELNNKLKREAEERGEEHIVTKLRRNIEMDEYDFIHWRRSYEEREALLRDISCRQALGLPLMEPGRYMDASILGKGEYDPTDPLYRYDYWGEPKNSEKSIQDRNEEAEYNSITGKGTVYSEMSYEDAIKKKMRREAREREARAKARQKKEAGEVEDADGGQDDDDYDDNDIDFGKLSENSVDVPNDIVVNGTESPSMSDGSMFDD